MEAKDFGNNAYNNMQDSSHYGMDTRALMADPSHMTNHMDPYNQRFYTIPQGNMNPMQQSRMQQQDYIVPQMPISSPSMLQVYRRVPLPSPLVEDEPIYVNAKQFQRIIKRRQARAKYETEHDKSEKRKEPYMHKSRHEHAKRRARGPGGRFLSKREIEERGNKSDSFNESDENEIKNSISATIPSTDSISMNNQLVQQIDNHTIVDPAQHTIPLNNIETSEINTNTNAIHNLSIDASNAMNTTMNVNVNTNIPMNSKVENLTTTTNIQDANEGHNNESNNSEQDEDEDDDDEEDNEHSETISNHEMNINIQQQQQQQQPTQNYTYYNTNNNNDNTNNTNNNEIVKTNDISEVTV